MKKMMTLVAAIAAVCSMSARNVEIYSYADQVAKSDRYKVTVEGSQVSVLQTAEPDLAIFGAGGPVKVKVTFLKGAPDSVAVRPIAKGYKYTFKKNTLKRGDGIFIGNRTHSRGKLSHKL